MKLFPLILLIILCANSYAGVATHVAISSAVASSATHSAAENQVRTQQLAINTAAHAEVEIPIGMLQCKAHYDGTPYRGYLYDGCEDYNKNISIQKYFEKYKPEEAKEIIMVIADAKNNIFYIYFN